MEFWPKRSNTEQRSIDEKKVVASEDSFSEAERAGYARDFDNVHTPEDFIGAVDFETLNGIFDDLQKKSEGSEPVRASGHRVSLFNIRFKKFEEDKSREGVTLRGTANVSTGSITLAWPEDENGSVAGRAVDLLHVLVHEATHIRGGYDHISEYDFSDDQNLKRVSSVRVGISETSVTSATQEEVVRVETGISLNEAITETIAHEVLYEYLIRTGNRGYLENSYMRLDIPQSIASSYIRERLILGALIETLASELSVPRDEVWRGFVQVYMSGSITAEGLLSHIEEEMRSHPEISRMASEIVREGPVSLSIEETMNSFETYYKNRLHGLRQSLKVFSWSNGVLDGENLRDVLGLR